jgi:spore coat protein U-like protein
MQKIRGVKAILAALTVAAAMAPAITYAGTASSTASINGTVVNNCQFGTATTLSFGNYDPIGANKAADLVAAGSVNVVCTAGDDFTITADAGANGTNATGTTRAMSAIINSTPAYLSYDLYADSAYSTVWNTTNALSATGTGSSQNVSFYGRVPAAQNVAAGSYSDTVNLTVTF